MNFKKIAILLVLSPLMMEGIAFAEDTIIFISGRVMHGSVIEVDSLDIKFEYEKKKKKKEIFITKNSVFAIKYGDGKSEIFYKPLNAEEYSVREMELYIKGEQDAMSNTKAPLLFIGGVILGGFSTAYLGPFLGLIPLLPYALLAGSINTKVKEGAVSNPDFLREDTYITGYVTKAKNIKIQNAIKGSIAGYLVGLAAIAINTQINPED